MKYKHDDNTIDPRDINLVSYNPKSKRFITEASMLKSMGIQPFQHLYTIGGWKAVIYMWSEKHQYNIVYKQNREVKSPDGELIATVFVPYFGIISGGNQSKAHTDSLGTELHILND
jgi:hypothetical protein